VIDLVARDDRAGWGVACALDVERIPYRRLLRAADFDARLLVVATPDAGPDVVALARRVPTLVVGGGDVARALFDVDAGAVIGPLTIPLAEPIWPAGTADVARRFGADGMRFPSATACVPRGATGRVLASRLDADGVRRPAVVASGRAHWCLADVGALLADLADERWHPAAAVATTGRVMPRALLALYYRMPDAVRRTLQRRVYARLGARLGHGPSSAYPVDAAGWLLLEFVKALVHSAGGGLVRLARWPAPYASAAALTHDVEPSRFAYTRGIARLLDRVERGATPATIALVARPAAATAPGIRARLARHDVACHGLEHRGETLARGRAGLDAARRGVAAVVGRTPDGFRSPRLDRSPALLRDLDAAGFRWDSSYPDVDRENARTFGAGVRLNVPFRPPIDEAGGRVRPSRCLELPVSAPDCIQPLFAGESVRALADAVRQKTAFTRATGGLYVGIVHAGVFGPRDAARRSAHLGVVRRRLQAGDVWRASLDAVAAWWSARERVAVAVLADRVDVRNDGAAAVAGLRLVLGVGDDETTVALPSLPPGATTTVPLDGPAAARVPA